MKKVLFVLAVAAAMVACGTKNAENTEAAEEAVVCEEVCEEAAVEAEAVEAEANEVAEIVETAAEGVVDVINAAKAE